MVHLYMQIFRETPDLTKCVKIDKMLSEVVSDNSNTESNILTNDIVPCKFEFDDDEVKVTYLRLNIEFCDVFFFIVARL